MATNQLEQAATQSYVYGYPLTYNLREVRNLVEGSSLLPAPVPWNTFGCARELLGPDAHFVTPNNDTLYLIAPCDLSAGPVLLEVPDTAGRYYVLQFVDAWTNNFAYVGRRASGTGAGRYLLVPPGGAIPGAGDVDAVIEAPSTVFAIVGRVQVDGAADLAAAHAVQDGFTLQVGADAPDPAGLPAPAPGVPDELAWCEELRVALAAFPPPPGDAEFLEAAGRLGLLDAESPYVSCDEELAGVLAAARERGDAALGQARDAAFRVVDGWTNVLHAFDYNLDHLGFGTLDDDAWRIADRRLAYITRAVAAREGLWGNHGYEARYDLLWQDEHGDGLVGTNAYELVLAPPPAVDAFWSLTMYDDTDFYLVDNPIDRYSIGDRTPGLQVGEDGSVRILMQHERPAPEDEANWLPAPAGGFRPVLRCYEPAPSLLSADFRLPAVRRLR